MPHFPPERLEKMRVGRVKAVDARRGFSDADILAAIEAGQTRKEIQVRFPACHASTIWKIARNNKRKVGHDVIWDDPTIQQLRYLWAAGHSTAEIGRRLGVSKNAIVGKAHRLDLTERPSPIRRDPAGAPKRERLYPAGRTTLPPLRSTMSALPKAPTLPQPPRAVRATSVRPPQTPTPAAAKPVTPSVRQVAPPYPAPRITVPSAPTTVAVSPPAVRRGPRRQCEMLKGDRRPYIQCDGEAMLGKSWCEECAKQVFAKKAA